MHETEIMNSVIHAMGPWRHGGSGEGREGAHKGMLELCQVFRIKHYFFKGKVLRECRFLASIVRNITGKAYVLYTLHVWCSRQYRSMFNIYR
jgi:hypothetical protein